MSWVHTSWLHLFLVVLRFFNKFSFDSFDWLSQCCLHKTDSVNVMAPFQPLSWLWLNSIWNIIQSNSWLNAAYFLLQCTLNQDLLKKKNEKQRNWNDVHKLHFHTLVLNILPKHCLTWSPPYENNFTHINNLSFGSIEQTVSLTEAGKCLAKIIEWKFL